jgi:hypothetical protein
MADTSHEYEGRNSLLSVNLSVDDAVGEFPNTNQYENTQAAPSNNASQSDEDSFGDLLAQLLRTLPTEASTLFLKSLSGLSPSESGELCAYVSKLKAEKQFRVIRAMAESTFEGKKRFLSNLRSKFELQQAKEREIQAQEEQDLEEHMKRKQALSGASYDAHLHFELECGH